MKQDLSNPQSKVEFADVRNLPFFTYIVVLALFAAISWGIYFELGHVVSYYPLGTLSLLNFVGMLTYSLSSLVTLSVSASVVYKGFRSGVWSLLESSVFYAMFFLSLLFLATAFQFYCFETMQIAEMGWVTLIKIVLIAFFLVYLYKIYRLYYNCINHS